MAMTNKRKKKHIESKKPKAAPKGTARTERIRKVRVIEEGTPEQESDRTPSSVSNQEREEYRHGGIPLGSDPRE